MCVSCFSFFLFSFVFFNYFLYNLKFVVFGLLGTDPTECDVVLHLDDKVSGEHSFIQYHEDTACFYYVDDSTNGSIVCGDKCVKGQPVVISDGVVCEMGSKYSEWRACVYGKHCSYRHSKKIY